MANARSFTKCATSSQEQQRGVALYQTGLMPDTDLFVFLFSLDPSSKRVASRAESSQPVGAQCRETEGGGLVISPGAGPGGAEGGRGGSTAKGSTFDFIPMIIGCQECDVLLGPETDVGVCFKQQHILQIQKGVAEVHRP